MNEQNDDEDVRIRPEDLGEPGATTTGVKSSSRSDHQDDESSDD